MAGIALIIPGTGPGTGPVIPAPLHPTGVDETYEYVHRYVAEEFAALADGTNLSTVHDYGSRGADLTSGVTGASTVKKQRDATAGVDFIETIGAASTSNPLLSTAGTFVAANTTMAIVARLAVASTRGANSHQARITRNGAGQTDISRGSGTTVSLTGPGSGWAFIGLSLATGAYVANVNGAASAGSLPGSPSTVAAATSFGGNVGVASAVTFSFVESLTWDVAMNATELAAIRSAMKAKYPFLP